MSVVVLYQLSAKDDEMPTDSKMLYTSMECKKIFGSPYQIAKAILCPPMAGYDHRIFLWMIIYMRG